MLTCYKLIPTGLSNKENNWSVRLAVTAIKENIPCAEPQCNHPWHYEDLPNGKGFKRIRDCQSARQWCPIAMIDKHRPTKIGVHGIIRGTILCWFHIMQTLCDHFREWNIPHQLRQVYNWLCQILTHSNNCFLKNRYLITLGFKIIGRCRTEEEALEMSIHYKELINSLPLTQEQKKRLTDDLDNNWMCDEWRMQFIDAGRLPRYLHEPNPMTTNNYTERMNRTIESQLSGKQTVVTFIERLYGMKLLRENCHEEGTGQITYEAGFVTQFNMQSIEQASKTLNGKSAVRNLT